MCSYIAIQLWLGGIIVVRLIFHATVMISGKLIDSVNLSWQNCVYASYK